MVNKNLKNQDESLAYVEFAYNRSVHSATKHSPFEVVYGFNLTTPLDLAPIPISEKSCIHRAKNAQMVKNMHKKVREQIKKKNKAYERLTNKRRKQVLFKSEDLVSIHLLKERFPNQRKSKMMPWADGPFRVLEKVNDNAYKLELPKAYYLSTTFNV